MLSVSVAAFGLLLYLLTKARLPRLAALGVCASVFLGLAFYLVIALSRQLGADTFDESVIFHVINGYRGVSGHLLARVALITVAGLAAASSLCVWLYRRSRRRQGASRLAVAISAVSAVAFFTNPVVADLASTGYFQLTESRARPPEYRVPAEARFTRTPNIVYIYLESLERTYLDDTLFPGLAPHLRQLEAEAIHFTGIQQTYGTGWTMAGMVASQCGIPLSTDVWNSMAGLDGFLPEATCLGDLLSAQGYQLHYLGGADLAFGGKGSFYQTHRFNHVEGQAELAHTLADPAYQNDWGLYDDTLFDIVRRRFDALAVRQQPFALFTLTNGTHAPSGHLSRTCMARYGDGGDPILNAVHCADRQAAELVEHIRSSSAAGHTLIVIGSDHLAMNSPTTDRWLRGRERRNLLLMLAPGAAPERVTTRGTTMDAGATLLGLVSNARQLGFGVDLRSDARTLAQSKSDLHRFLKSKVPFLNTLWQFPALAAGTTIDPARGELLVRSRRVRLPVLFLLDSDGDTQDVVFPGRNDLYALSAYVARLARGQRFFWIDRCGELAWFGNAPADAGDSGYCLVHGTLDGAAPTVTHVGDSAYRFTAETLAAQSRHAEKQPKLYKSRAPTLDAIRRYGTANVVRYADSTPGTAGFTLVAGAAAGRPSFIEIGKQRTYIDQGTTLVELARSPNPPRLRAIDPCVAGSPGGASSGAPGPIPAAIAPERRTRVIVKTAGAECQGVDRRNPPWPGAKLERWRTLKAEDGYVGIVAADGQVTEYVGPAGTTLAIQASAPDSRRVAASAISATRAPAPVPD